MYVNPVHWVLQWTESRLPALTVQRCLECGGYQRGIPGVSEGGGEEEEEKKK